MISFKNVLIFFISYFYIIEPCFAYIGPGMAGGVIAATLGIIVALVLGLIGVLYYPIKRFLKNKTKKK